MSDPRPVARVDLTFTGTRITREHQRLRQAIGTPYDLSGVDRDAYAPESIAHACRFWRARMEAEHRSVQVFGQLALQLIEANAPLDTQSVMLRMTADEVMHTETCGRVLEVLGDVAAVDIDVSVRPLATHAGASHVERALRNVLYTTCLSEMVAVARIADSLETTTEPHIRSAVRSILADEVMHGQFGFLYLDALHDVLSADGALVASLERYLVHAFAVLEAELAGSAGRAPSTSAEAMALGVIDPARAHDAFYRTLEEAVVPGLEARGLGAAKAWRERRRLA